jgi:hypothetical protein
MRRISTNYLVFMSSPTPDWSAISKRNARSVQTTIGWIFWDPGAVARYEALGLPAGGGYIASRAAPFSDAGPDALTEVFGSISPLGISLVFEVLKTRENFMKFWDARNEAVLEGLKQFAPAILDPLIEFGPLLWNVVPKLPIENCLFAASHNTLSIPSDSVLSGWHAINFVREWRGDVHWNITKEKKLSAGEASVLHNAWLGYEGDWLSLSRGNSQESIDASWKLLEERGLAAERVVTKEGLALRQEIEDETDAKTSLVWELVGQENSVRFAELFEPPCVDLLKRVDITAGPNYQPASRIH